MIIRKRFGSPLNRSLLIRSSPSLVSLTVRLFDSWGKKERFMTLVSRAKSMIPHQPFFVFVRKDFLSFISMSQENQKAVKSEYCTVTETEWCQRSRLHTARVAAVTDPWLEKRSRQQKDPVLDFLFEYYPFRVSRIKRWSPGIGVRLIYSGSSPLPSDEFTVEKGLAYLDPAKLSPKRRASVRWILELLERSAERKPHFGCFGMHEWAMVYKAGKIRHQQIPLRLSSEEIDRFVESRPLLCTHYDAFRFFTDPAQPMNRHLLSRSRFTEMEQSGCIHTNMDLYKWAFKLSPWIEGELIADTFLNAVAARKIDMQASPYDARAFGLEPIRIETEEGRKEYLKRQMEIHDRSTPLRQRLIESCHAILRFTSSPVQAVSSKKSEPEHLHR